jgi:hypothetical protein
VKGPFSIKTEPRIDWTSRKNMDLKFKYCWKFVDAKRQKDELFELGERPSNVKRLFSDVDV